ncbi:transglycosylase family protein [Kribbella deserti]|uniref:Transglycosylase family protein n=1 Tax=Kribbella deserti TaxID=1926257 RepID=A0ABV6QTI7_9ACTN
MSKARHARPRRTRRVVRTLSIAGLGAGLTATGAGAAFAADYTVKPGDTLSEIAAQQGLDWQELARVNKLADPDLILIGQQLTLDGSKRASTPVRPSTKKSERIVKKRSTERTSTKQRAERKRTTERTSRSRDRSENRSDNTGGSAEMTAAWRKVANCESSMNPRAVNPAGYYGLFQFDKQTWRSVGGSGNPAHASAAEQYMRAKKLYAQRGSQPWPVCGRFLR